MKRQLKEALRELATNIPDMEVLRKDLQEALNLRDSTLSTRQRLNHDTRYCVWANQTSDGRRWSAPKGRDIFPWPGCSDAKVALIDKYVNEDVAALMVLWRRMKTQVSGTESGDSSLANRLTQITRWMLYTQMTESAREVELLANYILERGTAVMGVFWERRSQLGYEEIDLEQIKGLGMQAMQAAEQEQRSLTFEEESIAQFPQMVQDPELDEESAKLLALRYPDVRTDRLRKVVADLRMTGSAKFPRPYIVQDRPTIVTMGLGEDVFISGSTTDLQKARGIYRREILTETALRDRVVTHGWDQVWVDQMIETQRGKYTLAENTTWSSAPRTIALQTDTNFEVFHAFRRLSDEDGVPGIYYTCLASGLTESYASHALLNYDHGEYPFVYFERETKARQIGDSRGYGEVGNTWQGQIKTEWDSRIDRASIATLPPMRHPPGEAPEKWGPGVKIGSSRPEEYGFMPTPKYDVGSKEVESSVRMFSDEYFGRATSEFNAVTSQTMRQAFADKFMSSWSAVATQILQLMQQFMPDEFYFRVVGSDKAQPIHSSREEIQGKFDVSIGFDVANLDPEAVKGKISLVEQVIQMDGNGRIDRDEALAVVFDLLDPNLGERLLKPAEAASQSEIDDEAATFSKIFAGIPVDVRPGQAYQMRLQWLNNMLQQNPGAQKRYQEDPQFKEILDKRMKQLQFQIQQRENATIGRLGA